MGSRGTITISYCNSRFMIVRGEERGRAPFDGGGSGESGIERRAVVTAGEARGVKRRGEGKRRQVEESRRVISVQRRDLK